MDMNQTESPTIQLRKLLAQPGLVVAPGCYDAVSAKLIERAGFAAAYMTGFGSTASVLGLPDAGIMDFTQMTTHAGNLANVLNIPLIADADTGYGNAINTHRTVQTYARSGVAGIQLEDQVSPKRCGHTAGKAVIPLSEMLGKLRAARDASAEIVIVARTDARAVEGFDSALERCLAFEETGADVIFFEAPRSLEEMQEIAKHLHKPLLANMVEGGHTPFLRGSELETLGFKLAIYPVTLLLSAVHAMQKQLQHLREEDHESMRPEQVSFQELQTLVGFPEYDAMSKRYQA
jgi:2-methylisocitrate lyase-like PEP mutase family enzyme